MLHTCATRFDVTKNLEKFYKFLESKQGHRYFMLQSSTKYEGFPHLHQYLVLHAHSHVKNA